MIYSYLISFGFTFYIFHLFKRIQNSTDYISHIEIHSIDHHSHSYKEREEWDKEEEEMRRAAELRKELDSILLGRIVFYVLYLCALTVCCKIQGKLFPDDKTAFTFFSALAGGCLGYFFTKKMVARDGIQNDVRYAHIVSGRCRSLWLLCIAMILAFVGRLIGS